MATSRRRPVLVVLRKLSPSSTERELEPAKEPHRLRLFGEELAPTLNRGVREPVLALPLQQLHGPRHMQCERVRRECRQRVNPHRTSGSAPGL